MNQHHTIYINGRFLTQKLTGSQRNSYELFKNLFNIYQSRVVLLVPTSPIVEAYEITGFPIIRVGKYTGVVWEQMELPFFLKHKGKPLLVNLTNTAPLFYSNQLVSIMDMTTFVNPEWFSKSFAMYYRWLLPKLAKKAKKVITISECSKRDIIKYTGISSTKVKVISCAVPKQFLINAETLNGVEEAILNDLGVKAKAFFLAVSSLDPRKNFVSLIRAYNLTNLDIPLVIVGSGGKAFNVAGLEQFKGDPKIKFTGYISDEKLTALYKSALCFIYPSMYEGFGIPPLEAMACNCPTIVSNTSSLPEVCGDASLYINPENIYDIATAMNDISANELLRKALIEKGSVQYKKFTWEKSSQELANEIDKLND